MGRLFWNIGAGLKKHTHFDNERHNYGMTIPFYYEDPYRCELEATVVGKRTIKGQKMFSCRQTIFYPQGGGQPGDMGEWKSAYKAAGIITDTRKDDDDQTVWHYTDFLPPKNATIRLILNWPHRRRLMRNHTAMHLLCAAVNASVAGCGMHELRGRIDLCVESLDRDAVTAQINEWIRDDAPVSSLWIGEDELAQRPELVRSLSVAPPPAAGKIRLIDIKNIDLQTCGGTHVASLREVGEFEIVKVENKGRNKRRVLFMLGDE